MKFRHRVHRCLEAVPRRDFSLIPYDIERMFSKVVHMGLIEFAEAAALILEVKRVKNSGQDATPYSEEKEVEQLRIALAKVSTAANNAAPMNPAMHFYWGNALEELAHRANDKVERTKLLKEAMERYRVISQRAHTSMVDDTNNYFVRAHLQLGCVAFELSRVTEAPLECEMLLSEARKMVRTILPITLL